MDPVLLLVAGLAVLLGAAVQGSVGIGLGLLAAPGLALKHHFLIFPALVEGWLIWRRKRIDVRAEHLALVGAALPKSVAIAVGLGWNFLLYSRVVFRGGRPAPPRQNRAEAPASPISTASASSESGTRPGEE